MDVWDALVSAGSLGFIFCLVPQFAKTMRTRRADDLSWGYLVLVNLASALALPYAVHAREWLLAASWACNLAVWGLVLYFKWRPARRAEA